MVSNNQKRYVPKIETSDIYSSCGQGWKMGEGGERKKDKIGVSKKLVAKNVEDYEKMKVKIILFFISNYF